MKKFLFCFLLFVTAIVSCKQAPSESDYSITEKEIVVVERPSYQFKNSEMALLNSQIDSIAFSYNQVSTRGLFGFLKKVAFVVGWDATGLGIGGYAGLAASSLAAFGLLIIYDYANNTRSGVPFIPISNYVNDSLTVFTNVIPVTYPSLEDSIGHRHNVLLFEASNNNVVYSPNYNISNYVTMFDSLYVAKFGVTPLPVNTDSLQMMVELMKKQVSSDIEFSDVCNDIRDMFPRFSDEISIMETYVSNMLQMTDSNKQSYTEDVLSQISNSSNGLPVKSFMRKMILTAYASSKLWNVAGNDN